MPSHQPSTRKKGEEEMKRAIKNWKGKKNADGPEWNPNGRKGDQQTPHSRPTRKYKEKKNACIFR